MLMIPSLWLASIPFTLYGAFSWERTDFASNCQQLPFAIVNTIATIISAIPTILLAKQFMFGEYGIYLKQLIHCKKNNHQTLHSEEGYASSNPINLDGLTPSS